MTPLLVNLIKRNLITNESKKVNLVSFFDLQQKKFTVNGREIELFFKNYCYVAVTIVKKIVRFSLTQNRAPGYYWAQNQCALV